MNQFTLINIAGTFILYQKGEDKPFTVLDQMGPKQFSLDILKDDDLDEEDKKNHLEKLEQIRQIIQSGTSNSGTPTGNSKVLTRTSNEEDIVTTLTKKIQRVNK